MPTVSNDVIRFSGLINNINPDAAPPGSLFETNNTMFKQDGVIARRNGFGEWVSLIRIEQDAAVVHSLHSFNSGVLFLANGGIYWIDHDENTLVNITTLSSIASYDSETDVVVIKSSDFLYREGTLFKRLVVNSDDEVVDGGAAALPRPRPPLFTGSQTADAWLADNNEVLYRIVNVFTAPDGTEVSSAPSDFVVVQNGTGNTIAPKLKILPFDDGEIRLYRSEAREIIEGIGGADDEMTLVATITQAGEFIDIIATTQTLALYTNASQEGIANGNYHPPSANVIGLMDNNIMAYGDVTPLPSTIFTQQKSIIDGYTLTLTVGVDNYVFTASNTNASPLFEVVADDDYQTLANLAYAINTRTDTPFYASVVREPSRLTLTVEALTITAFSNAQSDTTILSASSETANVIRSRNRVYFSKAFNHTAIPLANYVDIGDRASRVLAVATHRSINYIFKEDGVFQVTQSSAGIYNSSFLGRYRIAGDKAFTIFENRLYCLTTVGVILVEYQELIEVSEEISPLFIEAAKGDFFSSARLTSDEAEELFIVSLPQLTGDTFFEHYIFNDVPHNPQWTKWELDATDIILYGENLVIARNDRIMLEKRNQELNNFSDISAVKIPRIYIDEEDVVQEKPSSEIPSLNVIYFINEDDIDNDQASYPTTSPYGILLLGDYSDVQNGYISINGEPIPVEFVKSVSVFSHEDTDVPGDYNQVSFEGTYFKFSEPLSFEFDAGDYEYTFYRSIPTSFTLNTLNFAKSSTRKLIHWIEMSFLDTTPTTMLFAVRTFNKNFTDDKEIIIKPSGTGYGQEPYGQGLYGGGNSFKSRVRFLSKIEDRVGHGFQFRIKNDELHNNIAVTSLGLGLRTLPNLSR